MSPKTSLTLVIVAASLVSASSASFARSPRSHSNGFVIQDANSGDVIYDDGKLDGKACAVGTKAFYDPKTGTFKTVKAAKCNF